MAPVRNTPSPEGRALGEQLARLCEVEIERQSRQGVSVPERCASCAFRLGTFPNGCLATAGDALKCALEGVPFLCHESPKDEDGKHAGQCAGWLVLQGREPVAAPWPFSDERGGADA